MEALDPLRSVQSSGDDRLRATVFGILEATDRPNFATELAEVVPGSRQSISNALNEANEAEVAVTTDDGYMFTQRGTAQYRSITYDIQAALEKYLDEAPLMQMYQGLLGSEGLDTDVLSAKMMQASGLRTSGETIHASIDATPEVAAKLVESMWMSIPDELGPWSLRANLLKTLYSEFDRQPMLRVQPADEFNRHESRVIDIPEAVTETAVALGDIQLDEEFVGGANYRLITGRRGSEVPEITDEMTLTL